MYKVIKIDYNKAIENINNAGNFKLPDYQFTVKVSSSKFSSLQNTNNDNDHLLNVISNIYYNEYLQVIDGNRYIGNDNDIECMTVLQSIPYSISSNNEIYFVIFDNCIQENNDDEDSEIDIFQTKESYLNNIKNNYDKEFKKLTDIILNCIKSVFNKKLDKLKDFKLKGSESIAEVNEDIDNIESIRDWISVSECNNDTIKNEMNYMNIRYAHLEACGNNNPEYNNPESKELVNGYNNIINIVSHINIITLKDDGVNKYVYDNLKDMFGVDIDTVTNAFITEDYKKELSRIPEYDKYSRKLFGDNIIMQPGVAYICNNLYNKKPVYDLCDILYNNNRSFLNNIVSIKFNDIKNFKPPVWLTRSLIGRNILITDIAQYNISDLTCSNNNFSDYSNYTKYNALDFIIDIRNSNIILEFASNVNLKSIKNIYTQTNFISIIDINDNLSLEKIKYSIMYTKSSDGCKLPKTFGLEYNVILDKTMEEIKTKNILDKKRALDVWDTVLDKIIHDKVGCSPYSEIKVLDTKKSIFESLVGFDKYIGMEHMKERILKIISTYIIDREKRNLGFNLNTMCMHMAFKGNPGTAKTTVARIIAKVLYDEGILSKADILEIGRSDLVSGYVGQTAIKTKEVIDKGRGGVIFIDEAYSLNIEEAGGYGEECINTIVEQMELVKNDTIFIFAGYPKEMDKFIASNPGIKSRLGFELTFDNYTKEQLLEISESMIADNNLILDDSYCIKHIEDIIDANINRLDFGNGRFIRSIIEDVKREQSYRLYMNNNNLKSITLEEFKLIKPEDLIKTKENFSSNYTNEIRTLGFVK